MYKIYSGNIVPENGTIFVFGSNPEGRHGAGSAAVAVRLFGAKYGVGEGLQGDAYALPTTELRWNLHGKNHSMDEYVIIENIKRMYECARNNPDKNFKVAYRNQPNEVTLCGYSGRELMNLFKTAAGKEGYPDNVWFSTEWAESGIL